MIYTALITPFTEDGKEIDEEGLRQNVRFQVKAGVDGLVALGTTGEAPTLTASEKERVIQIVRSETTLPLMVGTGCFCTRQTIEMTKRAEELGADCALIITPYYNRPTQEGIYRHFVEIAKHTSLPLMLYNHPVRTGTNIELSTIKRLAEMPQVMGIKETGLIKPLIEAIERKDFLIMSGVDHTALECLEAGGNGAISVISNLLPEQMKKLNVAMHQELLPYFDASVIETNPIPIKALMNLWGMAAGPCRLPLCELSEQHLQEISRLTNMRLCQNY